MGDDVADAIRIKIVEQFWTDQDTFSRILDVLDAEVANRYTDDERTTIYDIYQATLHSDSLFKQHVIRLLNDHYGATINQNDMVGHASNHHEFSSQAHGFQMIRTSDVEMQKSNAHGGLANAWDVIPEDAQEDILRVAREVDINNSVMPAINNMVSSVDQYGGSTVMLRLAAIALGQNAWNNLRRWWNGEITGKRCAKNIVDSLACVSAGVAGGLVGATLGTLGGPVGTLVGGITGSVLAGQTAMAFSDWLTRKIFCLPKDEALEKAYNYFGVRMTSTEEEINAKYRKLCLRHHPDKGGKEEDFHEVQIQMGIIKLARGQVTN